MSQSRSFLVVEDDIRIARGLTRVLQPLGRTDVAHSLAAGLDALPQRAWTAIFLDLSLPDGSGLALLERARLLDVVAPTLVITGCLSAANVNTAYDLGATCICKPVAADRVTAFVQQCGLQAASAESRRNATVTAWQQRYRLTPTESLILQQSVEGRSRADVLADKGVAHETLRKHVHNLLRKTGDASLVVAAQRALREAM